MRPKAKSTGRPDRAMSFGEHLDELRKRLVLALFGVVPILIVSMVFGKRAITIMMTPLVEELHRNDVAGQLSVTGLLEHFNAYFYVSLVMALMVSAPWMLYQLWLFVAPGLFVNERRFIYILAPLSLGLVLLSAAFTYFVMLPAILSFFVGWNAAVAMPTQAVTAALPEGVTLPIFPVLPADPPGPPEGAIWINSAARELRVCVQAGGGEGGAGAPAVIRSTPLHSAGLIRQDLKVSQYIDLVFNFTLAFAAGFQMPVVVLLLGWVGIVTPAFLVRYRRHAIMVCAILGAVLTPGDPLSAALLGVPLYVLFEFGVLLLRWLPASRVRGERVDSGDVADEPAADGLSKTP